MCGFSHAISHGLVAQIGGKLRHFKTKKGKKLLLINLFMRFNQHFIKLFLANFMKQNQKIRYVSEKWNASSMNLIAPVVKSWLSSQFCDSPKTTSKFSLHSFSNNRSPLKIWIYYFSLTKSHFRHESIILNFVLVSCGVH